MATTTKKKDTTKSELEGIVASENKTAKPVVAKSTGRKPAIDDNAVIDVRSNTFGCLYYIDPVTKEQTEWDQCGEIVQLPMYALRHMKRGAIKFFQNQLITIVGFADENADKYEVSDIYKDLYITQYYKNLLDPSDYEEICSWDPDEIKERVSLLSAENKKKLIVALNTYIEKGVLDSLKKIRAFEAELGCELTRAE